MGKRTPYATLLNSSGDPGRDRTESICELIVFKEDFLSKRLSDPRRRLNVINVRNTFETEWIFHYPLNRFNNEKNPGLYRAAIVACGVRALDLHLFKINRMAGVC
jgi:hypothetical protein